MRVLAKKGGPVYLRTTNGSAMCNVTTSVIADHDLDYCVDWLPFAGIAQSSRSEDVTIKFLKSGIRIITSDSDTKFKANNSFGFTDGMPEISTRRKMKTVVLPFQSLKVLGYSSNEEILDAEAGLLTLTDNKRAYTFRHISLGYAPLDLVDETVYVRFEDVIPLSKKKHETVTTYLEEKALTIVGDGRWVRMPRSRPTRDYASHFYGIISKLKMDNGVVIDRKSFEVAAYRIKKSYGEVDVEFRIKDKCVSLTVIGGESGAHQEESEVLEGSANCIASTRIGIIYDAARALRHPKLTFMIPDLDVEPSKFLAMTDGEYIQAVSLRPEHSLRKV